MTGTNSIERRTLLASLSAVAAGGIAGCRGLGNVDGSRGDDGTGEERTEPLATGSPSSAAATTAAARSPSTTDSRTGSDSSAGTESTDKTEPTTATDPGTETGSATRSEPAPETDPASPTETRTPDPIDAGEVAVLEDFGEASIDGGTWVASQSVGVDVSSDRAAFRGEYGARLDTVTCERLVSGPGVADPLSAYPTRGETFDVFHRLGDGDFETNEDSWLYFGMQSYPTENGFTSDAYENGYALRNDARAGGFELRRVDDGEAGQTATLLDAADHSYEAGTWYRMEVDWADSTGDIVASLYDVTRSDWEGKQVAEVRADDVAYESAGAVVLVTEHGGHFDLLRRTNPV